MHAGLAAIRADEHQAQSAATPLQGYRIEYGYGLRGILDRLIADQTLHTVRISLTVSRYDTVVAEAALLAGMGQLEARLLLAPPNPRTVESVSMA